MPEATVQTQIDEINRKLDFIVGELAHQKRHRLEPAAIDLPSG